MSEKARTTKQSALIGALRGLIIAVVLCLMYSDDVNLDIAGLPPTFWTISADEARLLILKFLLITPLISLLGASVGVVIDRMRNSARQKYYRRAMAISTPFLFFFVILKVYAALCCSHPNTLFSQQAWQHGLINERYYMVDDLLKHQKLVGMPIKDVTKLLGKNEPDAFPWRSKSEHCLAYDLGHRTTKYGACLALYYTDNRITECEMTVYKYW
jgi:hypothetical protein